MNEKTSSFEKQIVDSIQSGTFQEIINQITSQDSSAIRDIDSGLCSLWQRGLQDKVMLFLEEILVRENQEFSIRQFNELNGKLIENKERSLDILITRWLLSKQVTLGRAAADLLENGPDDGIAVAVDLDQLQEYPEGIRVFLARKACGWFFYKPISATSFIVSLIDSSSKDDIEEITDILFHPLLISDSGCVKDYFIKRADGASEKTTQLIKSLLKKLDIYHEDSVSTGHINELLPTQAQGEIYSRYLNRLINEPIKDRPQRIPTQHFKPTPLLYGNSVIHYIHHGQGDQKSRLEIPLGKITHSSKFPIFYYIDPHTLESMLFEFKIEGCES